MTPERKAEVNRRLAEFDGMSLSSTHYTADLNALARLEAKLTDFSIWKITRHPAEPTEQRFRAVMVMRNTYTPTVYGGTESEARAEAICQYLEQRHEEKISAR